MYGANRFKLHPPLPPSLVPPTSLLPSPSYHLSLPPPTLSFFPHSRCSWISSDLLLFWSLSLSLSWTMGQIPAIQFCLPPPSLLPSPPLSAYSSDTWESASRGTPPSWRATSITARSWRLLATSALRRWDKCVPLLYRLYTKAWPIRKRIWYSYRKWKSLMC